jgi:hypothetical protein
MRVFGGRKRERMRALRTSRGTLGLALSGLNLIAWAVVVLSAPPLSALSEILGPDLEPLPPEPGQLDGEHCFDCPTLVAFGRAFGSTWDSVPVKLLIVANTPALRSSLGAPKRYGIRVVNPLVFVVLASVQWVLVGMAWGTWTRRRRRVAARDEAAAEQAHEADGASRRHPG